MHYKDTPEGKAKIEFVKILNDAGVWPTTDEGKVIGFIKEDDDGNEIEVSLESLNVVKGWIDEHPEGSDRGGYVPFVVNANGVEAYHMENDGCWQ